MQANDSTHPAPPTTPTLRRLLVLVDGPFPGDQHYRAGLILARAQGADVLVVAPTLPVAGERWIIDLDAREAQGTGEPPELDRSPLRPGGERPRRDR